MALASKRKSGWWKFIALLTVLVFTAAWAANEVRSLRDRSIVEKMMRRAKTVCVGRFLVDVPEGAEVSLRGERIDGFDVETTIETEDAFTLRTTAREYDIAARGPATDGTGGMVEARDLRGQNLTGRTFIYGLDHLQLMAGERYHDVKLVAIESHAHIGGTSVTLSADGVKAGRARLAEALLAQLRPRGDSEIPAQSGFCGWRIHFVDPVVQQKNEHISMHISLPAYPDLAVAFSSMPGGNDESLLERIARIDAHAGIDKLLRVTKLRSGKRAINGLAGEEVLERVRELNLTTGFGFMWEVRGVEGDPLQPYLLLQMETGTNPRSGGKPVATSLHQDAVLALWDRISSSIRPRPSAPAG